MKWLKKLISEVLDEKIDAIKAELRAVIKDQVDKALVKIKNELHKQATKKKEEIETVAKDQAERLTSTLKCRVSQALKDVVAKYKK